MKTLITNAISVILLFSTPAHAKDDARVTYLKVKKVTIEETVITIVVEEAKTQITLIKGDYDAAYQGDTWNGMPVTRVQVISNEATFTIKQTRNFAPGGALALAWKDNLKRAKELNEGKEVASIGFYHPDIVIQGNMITSIAGGGIIYAK